MKTVAKTLLLTALLLIPVAASAAQADLTWTSDGVTSTRIERQTGDAAQPWVVQQNLAPGVTSFRQQIANGLPRVCYKLVKNSGFGDTTAVPPVLCDNSAVPTDNPSVIILRITPDAPAALKPAAPALKK